MNKILNFPVIDTNLCTGCGVCIIRCRFDAIVLEDGIAKILNEKCKNCRACVRVCPTQAII